MPGMRATIFAQNIFMGCVLGGCLFFLPNDAQSATSNSASLRWAANSEPDLAGYRIYQGTAPGIYGAPQAVGKKTTYKFANLKSNTTHYFAITAFDTSGNESLPSHEVSKTMVASSASGGGLGKKALASLTISNLKVTSGQSYVVPASGLQAGGKVFRDRSYTFTTVPTSMKGAVYIQTANVDKAATNAAFLSFTVNQPVTVYVAHDARITKKPAWLSTFTATSQHLGISGHGDPFRLFARSFSAGTITLGGNASGGAFSMYSVVVQPQSGSGNPTPSTNVLWRNSSSGEVAVWLMDGMTIASVGFPGSTSTDWIIQQVGDMNGDGQPDVLWRNSISGVVAVWLMNGETIISSSFLGGVLAEWKFQGIGDVNGDGKGDVVWRNSKNGLVNVWLMNGLAISSVGLLGSTPMAWEIGKLGDVNGDGKADMVWQHKTNGTVAVWLMNGMTIQSVVFPASTSSDWKIQAIGDVNGDGKMDVIWRNADSGMVAIWLMNGKTIAAQEFVAGVPVEWKINQVNDMNGDGKGDILFHNQKSGVVTVWLMDGLSINSVRSVGSTPVNWKIQG